MNENDTRQWLEAIRDRLTRILSDELYLQLADENHDVLRMLVSIESARNEITGVLNKMNESED